MRSPVESLHSEAFEDYQRKIRIHLTPVFRTSIWVMAAVLLIGPFHLATAMEKRLLLGPSPKDVDVNGLPRGWQVLRFHDIPRQTQYVVDMEGNRYAIKAVSESSASGIYTEVNLQPEIFQQFSWEWKVGNLIQKGDATQKSGDDFPARVIVAFRYQSDRASLFKRVKYELTQFIYGRYPPGSALVYVWDHQFPVGSMFDNAYTDWAKVVVVESGPSKVGQWVIERRNLIADYKSIFGKDPPQLQFIGIMTDTDDTEERAVAYYRQITLESPSIGLHSAIERERK